MMRISISILILFLDLLIIKSQSVSTNDSTIPNIVPPTHQTFSLSKVNYGSSSDGKFHHSIPLFSIDEVSKTSVSLNYKSDVKVDDIGGNAGMSWQLNFGGVVSRVVRDETDEGGSIKWRPTSINETTDLEKIREAARQGNNYDTEDDWFSFSISNGLSGSFYIDKNLNVFSESSENIKVEVSQIGNISTMYGKKLEVKLTDSSGNEYYFGGDDQYIERTIYINGGPGNSYAITGWYLSKIVTYKNEEINFQYDIDQIHYLSSASAGFNIKQVCMSNGSNTYSFSDIQKSKSVTNSFTPRIKSIQTNTKRISFDYGKNRNDVTSSNLLTAVSLYDSNLHLIKQFGIEYNDVQTLYPAIYYNISSSDRSTTSRHFLKSVTNLNDVKDKYFIEYYDIDKIPARFSLNTDYYNYYNSKENHSPFPKKTINNNVGMLEGLPNVFPISLMSADKEVNPANASIGNLRKIHYPTGGFSEVSYEPNHFKKDVVSYNPTTETIKLDRNTCKNVNIITKSFEFRSNGTSARVTSDGGYYHSDCNPEMDDLHDKYEVRIIKKLSGETVETVSADMLQALDYSFSTVADTEYIIICKLNVRFTTVNVDFELQYNLHKVTNIVPQYVGGSRVSKIEESEGTGQKYTKKYYYNSLLKINDPESSMVNYSLDKTVIERGEHAMTCNSGSSLPHHRIMDIYRVYENSIYNDFNIRDNSIFYTDVTEIIDGHSAKETKFSYADDIDPNFLRIPIYVGVPMSNYGQIYRGNITNENKYEFKNGVFKIQEAKTYDYNYIVQPSKKNFFFREHFTYSPLTGEDPLINVSYGYYTNYYGFRKQTQVKTVNWINDVPLETKTDYSYNNPAHNQLSIQKTTFPDSSYQTTDYSYAHEKGKTLMINKNMVGIPLETLTKKGIKTLSKTETNYPDILPDTQTGNLLLPKSMSSLDLVTGNMSTEVKYDQYDANGNLQQYTTKSGVSTAMVWGYNSTQPIAKIEGAKYSQVSAYVTNIVGQSNVDSTNGTTTSEQDLVNALDLFRQKSELSGFQITTYSYDPLIGVKSITPSSGVRQVYIYDNITNRLKEVREHSQTGNLLKEYQYHYKPSN